MLISARDSKGVGAVAARFDPRMQGYEDQNRHAGMVYVLMLVVAAAFGGFVWQLYAQPEAPRIAAPSEPYKVEPPPSVAGLETELPALVDSVTEEAQPPVAESTVVAPPVLTGVLSSGPYLAQLAALQNEAGAEVAWQRIAARAPGLFAAAQLDVERADLGQRGIYYRVRAGYFADRASAAEFCERVKQLGQDCIAVAR